MSDDMIPDYNPIRSGASLRHHGSYPQAARIATAEGHRSGGPEWWDRIREIRRHWTVTGQIKPEED
jgi:hypothetical protein